MHRGRVSRYVRPQGAGRGESCRLTQAMRAVSSTAQRVPRGRRTLRPWRARRAFFVMFFILCDLENRQLCSPRPTLKSMRARKREASFGVSRNSLPFSSEATYVPKTCNQNQPVDYLRTKQSTVSLQRHLLCSPSGSLLSVPSSCDPEKKEWFPTKR